MKRGFTLLELLIVLALIGLLIRIVIPSLITFKQNQAIQNTTNAVVSVLNDARAKTLAAYNNTYYSVRFETGQVVLFAGGTYTSGASTNDITKFDSNVTLGTVSLNGAGSQISFDRLKGTTSQYGTIVVSISGGPSRTITVTQAGIITRN